MKRRTVVLVATALLASLILPLAAVSSAEARAVKYKPAGGKFFAFEWADGDGERTRWGRVGTSGIVKPLTRDLGLPRVLDADYSSQTGLVYVLAGTASNRCEVWTLNPDNPRAGVTLLAPLTRVGFDISDCESLAVVNAFQFAVSNGEGAFSDEVDGPREVNYFDLSSGGWSGVDLGYDSGTTDRFVAMAWGRDGVPLTVRPDGSFTSWTNIETSVSGQLTPLGYHGYFSLSFDNANSPWVARNSMQTGGVTIGKMNIAGDSVKWGAILRESRKKAKWDAAGVVFIPNDR